MTTIAAASTTTATVVPKVAQADVQKPSKPVPAQKIAPIATKAERARVEAPAATLRFSTKALSVAYMAISALGGMLAYWICPTAAIAGAIAGFAWCFVEGNRNRVQETQEARGSIVALIGITTLASLYAVTNPGASLTSALLGLQGAATGFYPLARDFVDGV